MSLARARWRFSISCPSHFVEFPTREPARAPFFASWSKSASFCASYQNHALVNLPCQRIEADETWGFCSAKDEERDEGRQGDLLWTHTTALDADSKLVVSWLVGRRNHESTFAFMSDMASRLASKVQLTTDGFELVSRGTGERVRLERRPRPAMACGLTDHVWTIEEVLGHMDPSRLVTVKRAHYPNPLPP